MEWQFMELRSLNTRLSVLVGHFVSIGCRDWAKPWHSHFSDRSVVYASRCLTSYLAAWRHSAMIKAKATTYASEAENTSLSISWLNTILEEQPKH